MTCKVWLMKHAETVTFGGSALDRAAEVRGDAAKIADLRSDPTTRAVLLWRGKPLLSGDGSGTLALVAMDHPALADAAKDKRALPMFL